MTPANARAQFLNMSNLQKDFKHLLQTAKNKINPESLANELRSINFKCFNCLPKLHLVFRVLT